MWLVKWLWIPLALVAISFMASLLGALILFPFSFFFAPRFLFQRKPQTAPYARQKVPKDFFHAVLREIYTGFLFFSVYLLFPFVRGLNLKPDQRVTPVILVHGVGVSRASWYWFMRILERAGMRRPMYALDYNWLYSVEKATPRLAKLIDKALAEQKAEQVDIVCHSWGCFLARWYIEKLSMSHRVRRLIMICGPLQGTWMTLLGLGGPRRQLVIGGPVVESLRVAPPTPPYAVLWADCDEIVVPPQLSLLPDPDGNPIFVRQFCAISHVTMMRDREVANLVADLLEDPVPWSRQTAARK